MTMTNENSVSPSPEFIADIRRAFKHGVATEFVATGEITADGRERRAPADPRQASVFAHLLRRQNGPQTIDFPENPAAEAFRDIILEGNASLYTVSAPLTDDEGNLVEIEVRREGADGTILETTRHERVGHHLVLTFSTAKARQAFLEELREQLPELFEEEAVLPGEAYFDAVRKECGEEALKQLRERLQAVSITGHRRPARADQVIAIHAAPNPQGIYMNTPRAQQGPGAPSKGPVPLEGSDLPF